MIKQEFVWVPEVDVGCEVEKLPIHEEEKIEEVVGGELINDQNNQSLWLSDPLLSAGFRKAVLEPKLFRCYHCRKTCGFLKALRDHIKLYHLKIKPQEPNNVDFPGLKELSCTYCQYRSTSEALIKYHILHKHLNENRHLLHTLVVVKKKGHLMCSQCPYECQFPHQMRKHVEVKHEKGKHETKVHKCPFCGQTSEHVTDLMKHISLNHKPTKERKPVKPEIKLILNRPFNDKYKKVEDFLQIKMRTDDDNVTLKECPFLDCLYVNEKRCNLRIHFWRRHGSLQLFNQHPPPT